MLVQGPGGAVYEYDNGKPIQVRVFLAKSPFGDPPRWTTIRPEQKRDILDYFFVTLYTNRDDVANENHAKQFVEKWIEIKGLQQVPVEQILHVLRNKLGWGPPL